MAEQYLPPMTELLALETIERDLFRGRNEIPDNGHRNIFGGQIAAQALKAAGMTVTDRWPHSFHGYFLRPGRRASPVIFKVERDRDGRSFSARRVRAIQDGKVIFDLTASFQVDESGPELSPIPPEKPPEPEACPPEPFNSNFPAVEARMAAPVVLGPSGHEASPTLWVRCPDALGDHRLNHACVLAYTSDISSGFVGSPVRGQGGGASIDHAMWFQHPVRTDDWMLLHMWPALAGGARGLYQGSIHRHDGTAAALFAQQCLLRAPATAAATTAADAIG